MRDGVLIGIDAGTTVFKAAAFSAASGKVLAVATRRMPLRNPKPGWRETPATALDHALRSTFTELRATLGKRWGEVRGIGIASQGGSSIFVNCVTGAPLTSMILWNDGRAFAESMRLRGTKPEFWWRQRLLNTWTPAGLARLAWFKQHQRQMFENPKAMHVGAGEYLFHRLTGAWRQDAGNAIQIGSYDAARGRLTGQMLKLVGFPLSRVAPLREGHRTEPISERFAKRFDLNFEIPVAGPYMDQEAALQSVQGIGKRPLQCSLGTAWVGNFLLTTKQVGSAAMQFALRGAKGNERVIVLPLLTGNLTWDWALEQFIDRDHARALRACDAIFAERLLPPPDMVCVPWLYQGNPIGAANLGACTFHGVGPNANAEDFVRAVACGMCFELMRTFEQVKRSAVDSVIISGGASKARYFRNIIATLFAPIPVYVQENEDTAAARGALIAFGPIMAKSPVKRIVALRGEIAKQLVGVYRQYLRVFDVNYNDHPLAAPYTIKKVRA